MPTQSIDLSAVTDANFNGSAVDKVNLNGVEIWVGGPDLVYLADVNATHWVRTLASFGNIIGYFGEISAISDPANGDLHLGAKKAIGSDYKWLPPVGTSKLFPDGITTVNDHRTACRFNLDGSIADTASIAWVETSAGNPTYNIPPSVVGHYMSMASTGTLTIGLCSEFLAAPNINYWTTVAQVLSACQGGATNHDIGAFIPTTDSIGIVWTVVGGNDFVKSYSGQNKGLIWST